MARRKDCWDSCDYPAECRWGRQHGVLTPVEVEFSFIPIISPLLEDHVTAPTPNATVTTLTNGEGILNSENVRGNRTMRAYERLKNEKSEFWGALLASATRRKSVGSSPLASVAEEAEVEAETSGRRSGQEEEDTAMQDRDSDVVMSPPEDEPATVDPQHLILSPSSSSSSRGMGAAVAASINSSSPVVTLKEFIRKKSIKRKLRRVDSERAPDIVDPDSSWGSIEESQVDVDEDYQYDMPPLERVQSRQGFGWHVQMAEVR